MRNITVLLVALSLAAPGWAGSKKVIQPKDFPAGKPYSAGILVDDTLYIAGQIGADFKTGALPADFEAEAKQCFDNVGLILKEAGMSFDNAVAVEVYLTDMSLFARMNAIYTTYFTEPRPARATVGVAKLVGAARMEVAVTAHR
jgi:2-iminobutanoate/2-iminopropanoate deaminase